MDATYTENLMRDAFDHPWWDRFEQFDQQNPEVFDWFVRLLRHCRERGMTKVGMRYLAERFRWEARLENDFDDGFKLNANLVPLYARAISYEYPEFAEMFEFRDLISA